MNNPNVEQLENTISAYVNTVYKEVPPTEEEFKEKAELLRKSNELLMPVSDDEFNEILVRLRQNLVIQMDVVVYINDRNNVHQSWLPAKRADFDFYFWNRYKKYLEEVKHWNPRVTTNLGKISDEILDLCGDPSEDHFAIKGLVPNGSVKITDVSGNLIFFSEFGFNYNRVIFAESQFVV